MRVSARPDFSGPNLEPHKHIASDVTFSITWHRTEETKSQSSAHQQRQVWRRCQGGLVIGADGILFTPPLKQPVRI
jgi:hypothetical protein